MTPEEFMHTLTDIMYVNHFDSDTWKMPCDTQLLTTDALEAIQTISTQS